MRRLCSKLWQCLKENADQIGAAAAIVSTIAIIFGAVQVWQGRKALDAQATASALQSSREVLTLALSQPEALSVLYGVSEGDAVRAVIVNSILAMFSEQFMFAEAEVLPAEHWARFKLDLCDFVMRDLVEPQVTANIARGSYPDGFVAELVSCGIRP